MSQRGPAVVRFSLLLLVFAAFAMALVQPSQAGTETSPEIQDAAGDQALTGAGVSTCPNGTVCQFTRADIVTGYVNETATDLVFSLITSNDPVSASSTASYVWEFRFTVGGTELVASASAAGGATPTAPAPGGVATAATVDGATLHLTVPKSALSASTAGTVLSNLYATGRAQTVAGAVTLASDRAPNTGAGTDYILNGGSGNSTTPGDSDNDGLNDTCEQQYFGGLNSTHNGTGDADGDGLTNGQECALGTDPTKADTDGDGTGDKDDPFPSDPTKGGTSSGSGSSSGSRSSSSSRSTSNSGTGSDTSSTSGGAQGDGEVKNLDDAIERLRSDAGYVGLSAGGFLTVVVLAILALAVRWSL